MILRFIRKKLPGKPISINVEHGPIIERVFHLSSDLIFIWQCCWSGNDAEASLPLNPCCAKVSEMGVGARHLLGSIVPTLERRNEQRGRSVRWGWCQPFAGIYRSNAGASERAEGKVDEMGIGASHLLGSIVPTPERRNEKKSLIE